MLPVFLALIAAVLWGLWWIPLHYLERFGLDGALSGLCMNLGASAVIAVWLLARRQALRLGRQSMLGAVLIGAAVASYSTAVTMSDVVRVILLFYLAPAWSTLIEWRWMGRAWRWPSTLAIGASLTGAILILGGEVSDDPINWGDGLAILSGMAWAAGAALVFGAGRADAGGLTIVTSIAAVGAAVPFAWTSVAVPATGVALAMGIGVVYVLPILFLTLWSAQRLAPAALSFLLTAEILSGVISSAVLISAPFGPLRALGAGLIILGALAEVLPQLTLRRAR